MCCLRRAEVGICPCRTFAVQGFQPETRDKADTTKYGGKIKTAATQQANNVIRQLRQRRLDSPSLTKSDDVTLWPTKKEQQKRKKASTHKRQSR